MSEIFRWPSDEERGADAPERTDRPKEGEAAVPEEAPGRDGGEPPPPSEQPETPEEPTGPEPEGPPEGEAPAADDMFSRFWGSDREGRRARRGRRRPEAGPVPPADEPDEEEPAVEASEIVPTPALRPTQSSPPALGPRGAEPHPWPAETPAARPDVAAGESAPAGAAPAPPATAPGGAAATPPSAAPPTEARPARPAPPAAAALAATPPPAARPPAPTARPAPGTAPRRRPPPELERLRAAMDDLAARLERSPAQSALTDAIGEMRAEVDQLGLAVNTMIARLDTRPERPDTLAQLRRALEDAIERTGEAVAVTDRNGRAAFAVVSREVKALADQNQALTEQVQAMAEALDEVPRSLGGFRAEAARARSETLAAVESLDGNSRTAFTVIGREVRALIDRHRSLVSELRGIAEEVRTVTDELAYLRAQVRGLDETRPVPESGLDLE